MFLLQILWKICSVRPVRWGMDSLKCCVEVSSLDRIPTRVSIGQQVGLVYKQVTRGLFHVNLWRKHQYRVSLKTNKPVTLNIYELILLWQRWCCVRCRSNRLCCVLFRISVCECHSYSIFQMFLTCTLRLIRFLPQPTTSYWPANETVD